MGVGLHGFTSRPIFMKLILQQKSLNLKTGCNGLTFCHDPEEADFVHSFEVEGLNG